MVTKQTSETKYEVKGSDLMKKIKDIIHEGNARRITVTDKNGKLLLNIPLTFGVVGLVIAPVLVAVASIAAVTTECTITVDRK